MTMVVVDHENLFCYFSQSFQQQELSNTIELNSFMVYVLCGFSTECLKTSRDFNLLFENTMKTPCCVALLYILHHRPPSMFPFHLGVTIFHYEKLKLMSRPMPVLN